MLPAFATIDDLAARTPGGSITSTDEPRAQAALDDASAKIRAEAGLSWVDDGGDVVEDLPDIIVVVCLAAALRAFVNPEGLVGESIGTYSETRPNPSTDVYLTAAERRLIHKAAGASRGLWAQPTTRGPLETPGGDDTVYLPVVGGSPIPFTGSDGY